VGGEGRTGWRGKTGNQRVTRKREKESERRKRESEGREVVNTPLRERVLVSREEKDVPEKTKSVERTAEKKHVSFDRSV